jgi:ubiquinone/menaquinone biosynthesis C-methylase UbiE
MPKNHYQTNYSEIHLKNKFTNPENRHIKAEKTLAVIKEACAQNLTQCTVLEVGCFTGEISGHLAGAFSDYIALDIDPRAIQIAAAKNCPHNLQFLLVNAEALSFEDETFDIAICSHIYEHVPNPAVMMQEIYRTLKQGGWCYFAAGNKLNPVDDEYGLPFAPLLPKKMANFYVRMFRGMPEYYETPLTLPALRKLVRPFKVLDYTKAVVRNPNRFQATDMVTEGSLKQKLALFILDYFYWLSPTYIWMLEK